MGYLDPGFFGILAQSGLAVLLVLVSVFAFFTKPIKKFFKKFNRKQEDSSTSKEE